MNPLDETSDPLKRWADSALRQIPSRKAPDGFALRVLSEIRRRANLPWYQRPWTQWPSLQQWLSAFMVAALMVGIFGIGIPLLLSTAAQSPAAVKASAAIDSFGAIQSAAFKFTPYLRQLAGQLSSTHLLLAVGSLVAAWLSTLGLGAACWRVASQDR